jgi:polysaccharide deacetylase family protein (PEP-CTERM system associated)
MFNILTIDIEDYFQVHAFSDVIKFEDWGNFECRIERNTDRLLSILNDLSIKGSSTATPQHCNTSTRQHSSTSALKNNLELSTQNSKLDHLVTHSLNNSLTQRVKGTFFVLGWIAERYPNLVRRIQKEGHEIACHGYAHEMIYTQSKEEFRQDIRKAKAILEDITASEVIGYRAPSYSINNKSQWAFEVLVEEGFKYDSSIFPIRHDFYGIPNAPRFPFVISLNGNSNFEFLMLNFEKQQHGNTAAPLEGITPNSELSTQHYLLEFPISTVKVFGQNFPISGGGYFRLFPYSLIRKGLKSINQKENKPFIFYAHPWEIDPEQPRVKGLSSRSKFRHYVNLNRTEIKLRKLLEDFQFSTIRQLLIHNS